MSATISIDERHTEARFRFLPFVVALLLDRPLPAGGQRIDVGDPGHLTREVVEALREILPQAVLRWLVQTGGWQQQSTVRPLDDRPVKRRVWDALLWDELQLSFTHHSIDLLVIAFSLRGSGVRAAGVDRRAKRKEQTAERSERVAEPKADPKEEAKSDDRRDELLQRLSEVSLEHNGDLLLHHILFRNLWSLPPLREDRHRWLRNPLNVLASPLLAEEGSGDGLQPVRPDEFLPERLLRPDVNPLLPWLLPSALRHARSVEPLLWQLESDAFSVACRRAAAVERAWIRLVHAHRPDLLVPWLHFFTHMIERPTGTRADDVMAETITRHRRLSERQVIAEHWLGSLQAILDLADVNERLTNIHPVDRDAPIRLFLSEYQDCDFDRAVAQVHHLRTSWIPTIG